MPDDAVVERLVNHLLPKSNRNEVLYRRLAFVVYASKTQIDRDQFDRAAVVDWIRERFLEQLVAAIDRQQPDAPVGDLTPATAERAADEIFERVIRPMLERDYARVGRAPAFRRTAGPGLDRLVEERIGAALARR